MNKNINELIENYQVRKTNKQKISFISWLRKKTDIMGYDMEIDKYHDHRRNLIFGDLDNSKVILTAHYDTQPNAFLPRYSFMSNPFMLIVSELFGYAFVLGIFVLVRFLLGKFMEPIFVNTLSGVLLIGYIVQIIVGFENKHTLNDNTSGVATILSIMEELEEPLRDKVTFVFFDHEELGFLGSKNFKDRYNKKIKDIPVINFDCVANGNYMFFVTKKKFRNTEYNDILKDSVYKNFANEKEKAALIEKSSKVVYTSDQILFENSVGVTAMKKAPILGYYLERIHSQFDTIFQGENIEILKNTMIGFIRGINKDKN